MPQRCHNCSFPTRRCLMPTTPACRCLRTSPSAGSTTITATSASCPSPPSRLAQVATASTTMCLTGARPRTTSGSVHTRPRSSATSCRGLTTRASARCGSSTWATSSLPRWSSSSAWIWPGTSTAGHLSMPSITAVSGLHALLERPMPTPLPTSRRNTTGWQLPASRSIFTRSISPKRTRTDA